MYWRGSGIVSDTAKGIGVGDRVILAVGKIVRCF
jgi:hypothetical protein